MTTSLAIDLAPEELEAQAEQLRLVSGSGFSHVALAESIWHDLYGNLDDPSLLGFSDREKHNRGLAIEMWRALRTEWYELACTTSPKYEGLRAKIASLRGNPATVIVSSIAAGIAATIGLTAAILVPFVAIFIHGSLTIGNNAMCRLMAARADRDS